MNSLGLEYAASSSSDSESEQDQRRQSNINSVHNHLASGDSNRSTGAFGLSTDEEATKFEAKLNELLPLPPPQASTNGREAPTACDPALQQRIQDFLVKKSQNNNCKSLQQTLRGKKEFMNPYILEKVVAYFAIDQHGSHLRPDLALLPEQADEFLEEIQRLDQERQQRQLQQQRQSLEFVTSTAVTKS